jgi:hypothetical protein
MKRWLSALLLISFVCTGLPAAPKGPQVDLIDNRLSINAEAIPLERLLQLVDRATGMKSTVPPELAKRTVSVRFSGLDIADAFRKLFQGQPLDYVVIPGQAVIVTAASQVGSSADPLPPVFNSMPPAQPTDQPFVQEFSPVQGMPFQQQQQQQPPMVQTPFGPLPNPRAQQAQPNGPMTVPGQQQNTLFPQNGMFPQPGQQLNNNNNNQGPPVQILPANQANPNPFGTVSPFGTPNTPTAAPNNGLFGTVPVFNQSGAQPR